MNVHLKFVLPSHPRFLSVARATVAELGSVYGLSAEECRRIALAVDEAMANVIRHAYHGAFDGAIELNCQVWKDRLEFTLLDQGECPDPARLAPHPLDSVALSGRGTHIMRTVMDEVCYEKVPGGNQLRLCKRLRPAESAAADEGEK